MGSRDGKLLRLVGCLFIGVLATSLSSLGTAFAHYKPGASTPRRSLLPRLASTEDLDVSIPAAWQDLLALASDDRSSVVKDGVVDFAPWYTEYLDADADPSQWNEDGVVLGKGAFGEVVRAVDRETGELVALKRIPPTHPLAAQTIVNELQAAKAVGTHKFVVQLKAAFLHPDVQKGRRLGAGLRLGAYQDVVLVYRLALGGSLKDWIDKQHTQSSFSVDYSRPKVTDEALRIMRELTLGLQHVHSKHVQHRDLKPANILLSAGATAVIADFGIALVNRTSARLKGHAALGDFYFTDVESLVSKGLPYTLEDDVYSLGEVFIRILYGKHAQGPELCCALSSPRGKDLPKVASVVGGMVKSRHERMPLAHIYAALSQLEEQTLPSKPRPIVTEVFLGIGAIVTAATVGGVRRTPGRSNKGKMADNAQVYVCRHQGKRVQMQDEFCHSKVRCAIPASRTGNWRLLGIFDGHGGQLCSQFAARFLPHELRRILRTAEDDANLQDKLAERPDGLVSDELMQVAGIALAQALESLDGLFVDYKRLKQVVDLTGTTASVALIAPRGEAAVICNIGDSQVALAGDWEVVESVGRELRGTPGDLTLSGVYSPADADERERIEKAGGFVEYGRRGHRVNGVLAVSRALGYVGASDFANVVLAKPDKIIVRRKQPQEHGASIMFASDGAFEHESPEEVFSSIASGSSPTPDEATLKERMDVALRNTGQSKPLHDNAIILTCMLPPSAR